MTQQYLRAAKLLVGGSDKAGADPKAALDLSRMHIVFEVGNATTQALKYARIRVFNLSDETANTIQQEFTRVELSAGYGDDLALLFQGTICIVRHGKLNATDTFLEVVAQDGDNAYNFAVSNRTLASGWTPDQLHGALLQDMAPLGITEGHKPTFSGESAFRGKACYGMTRDYLSTLADQQGCDWNIENGKLNFIPQRGVLPGEAILLKPDCGLIGTPTQTTGGIEIRCLLNPRIRSGAKVQIDNARLATMRQRVPVTGAPLALPTSVDSGGTYKALSVQHDGDTRGQAWYTSMVCVAVDPTADPLTAPVPNGGPTFVAVPEVGG